MTGFSNLRRDAVVTDRKNAPWALAIFVLSYPVYRLMKLASRRQPSTA